MVESTINDGTETTLGGCVPLLSGPPPQRQLSGRAQWELLCSEGLKPHLSQFPQMRSQGCTGSESPMGVLCP